MSDKIEAGRRVADRLLPTENSIDAAIIDNAALTIALVKARRDAEQPCIVIQRALAGAHETQTRLVEARQSIVDTHSEILRIRKRVGLGEVDYGCGSSCVTGTETKLAVVEKAA